MPPRLRNASAGPSGAAADAPNPTLPVAMPNPSHRHAPRFDGKPKHLLSFLEMFETSADLAQLAEVDKVKLVGRYANRNSRELWETLDAFAQRDWVNYKADIQKLYPTTDETHKYSVDILEKLSRRQHRGSIKHLDAFGAFDRTFARIAFWLLENRKISRQEIDRLYWRSLDSKLRRKILPRLQVKLPNHDPLDPYTRDQISEAIRHVLAGKYRAPSDSSSVSSKAMSTEDSSSSSESDSSQDIDEHLLHSRKRKKSDKSKHHKRQRRHAHIEDLEQPKEEPTATAQIFKDIVGQLTTQNAASQKAFTATISDLVARLNPSPRGNISTSRSNGQPSRAGGDNPNRMPLGERTKDVIGLMMSPDACNFCGHTGHFSRNCEEVKEYEREGKLTRDEKGYILTPSGERIPCGVKDETLKSRLNSFLKRMKVLYNSVVEPGTSRPKTQVFEASLVETRGIDVPKSTSTETSREQAKFLENLITTATAMKHTKLAAPVQTRNRAQPESQVEPEIQILPAPPIVVDSQSTVQQSQSQQQPLRYQNRSKADDPALVDQLLRNLLEGKWNHITPAQILAASPAVRSRLTDYLRNQRIPVAQVNHVSVTELPRSLDGLIVAHKSVPLNEISVTLGTGLQETAVVDDGCQIVLLREDVWEKLKSTPINPGEITTMQGADTALSQTRGAITNLPITVGNITFYVQAQVVERAPCPILLGGPFWALSRCIKRTYTDGSADFEITDPNPPNSTAIIPGRPRAPWQAEETLFLDIIASHRLLNKETDASAPRALKSLAMMKESEIRSFFQLAPPLEAESSKFSQVTAGVYRRYKPVARKIKPIATILPEKYRIVRKMPENPIADLLPLPVNPPNFVPGERLTQERLDALNLSQGFLWPEEQKLLAYILLLNERGLAWNESEKGHFSEEYFEPVILPTVEHISWQHKNIPIPPGIREAVIDVLKQKISSGTYESSNSSYRSRWFIVYKRDGKQFRIVHDLQPLNEVTIRDSGVPPIIDEIIEEFAGCTVYTLLDLFVGYDHRSLAVESRDLTTFQTPLGPLRLTVLPMGYTNAISVFQGDVTWVLQDEIPNPCRVFLDDISLKGPRSYYMLANGQFETIPDNPGIRRFIWQHFEDLHRVLHRLRKAGATLSGKKLKLAVPEISLLGHRCTYNGRVPDQSHIQNILNWPICQNVTQVRGFLGVCGLVRIFVKDFSIRARPLISLTKKGVRFHWGEDQDAAFADLKQATVNPPALQPIDYKIDFEVILAVDSSVLGVGFVLMQLNAQGKRQPARYNSISFNDRESRYSQAKLELYGLLRALKSCRLHVISLRNFTVEVDAKYIKGMLNNPDELPNTVLNRWIAYIQLFDFRLRHVPKEQHRAPDALSRREDLVLERMESEEDVESHIEDKLESFRFSLAPPYMRSVLAVWMNTEIPPTSRMRLQVEGPPQTQKRLKKDADLDRIKYYLEHFAFPSNTDRKDAARLSRYAADFFLLRNKLWRRERHGKHQQVLFPESRMHILRQSHDLVGHRAFFATRTMILERFWWPTLQDDLKWYLQTCHECQLRSTFRLKIPASVPVIPTIFSKAHIDTMHMPRRRNFRYIVQARCALTAWPEWRALVQETGASIGAFIFEEILCRWGALSEIVTDNGPAMVKALEWLAAKYHINHIRISPYNSQANGIVESSHYPIRESIVKACKGNLEDWPLVAAHCFWADRVTTRRSTGHTPYYMVHGVEAVMPFDLSEATYLAPDLSKPLSTKELIAARADQLRKRETELEQMKTRVARARFRSVEEFNRRYATQLRTWNFKPGALVLVRNSRVETTSRRKTEPRYMGPFVVVSRNEMGAYCLAEMDGTISELRFAAKRVVPYHYRSFIDIPSARIHLDQLNSPEEIDVSGDTDFVAGEEV